MRGGLRGGGGHVGRVAENTPIDGRCRRLYWSVLRRRVANQRVGHWQRLRSGGGGRLVRGAPEMVSGE